MRRARPAPIAPAPQDAQPVLVPRSAPAALAAGARQLPRPRLPCTLAVLAACALLAPPALAGALHHVDADATGAGDGSSWTDAFVDLQAALAVATAGDVVRVAEGTYRPSVEAIGGDPRSATFVLVDGVALLGGYAGAGEPFPDVRDPSVHRTVLSGDIGVPVLSSDDAYHVVWCEGVGPGTVLDGFTIRDGRATGFDVPDGTNGAGLFHRAGALVVRRCTFEDNVAQVGSGAGMVDEGGAPRLEDCDFVDNEILDGDGAGFASFGGSPVLDGCEFVLNDVENGFAGGGAVIAVGGSIVLRHGLFLFNHCQGDGGAVRLVDCEAEVRGCVFDGNGACAGGALAASGGAALVEGCTFVDNFAGCFVAPSLPVLAGRGGALASLGADADVVSCRFLANRSGGSFEEGGEGAAGWLSGGAARFTNCLFAFNAALAAEISLTSGGAGGALVAAECDLLLASCTLHGNRADDEAGGDNPGSVGGVLAEQLTVHGSILWGNLDGTGTGLGAQLVASALTVASSCIEGWTEDVELTGTIAADPLFVDPDGADDLAGTDDDDLRLAAGSPCADAGEFALVPADVADLDRDGDVDEATPLDLDRVGRFAFDPAALGGRRRVDHVGAAPIDMGAYERSGWSHLGHALAGELGEPCAVGRGTLVGGEPVSFALTGAAPRSRTVLFVGATAAYTPYKGGVLVPARDLLVHGHTSLDGQLVLLSSWPVGLPAGVDFFYQFWLLDESGPLGAAASNGLASVTP